MALDPKNQDGLLGTGINTRTALTAAQVGSNFVPGGMAVGGALDMASAHLDADQYMKEASTLMGQDVRHLSGAALKNYIKKDLPEIYGDRAMNFGFSISGGLVSVGVATAVMGGPPGWIMGSLIGVGGTLAAMAGKDYILPSNYNNVLNFAYHLQAMGQQQTMTPEAAFVALTINAHDEQLRKDVYKHLGVKDARGMIKLLNTEDGKLALQEAMFLHDNQLRHDLGAMSGMAGATVSERFARAVNNGKIAGVDLLDADKTGQLGNLIAMAEMQEMAPPQPQMPQANPNQHLPSMNTLQRGV